MLLVRNRGGGAALTETIFGRGKQTPTYHGAPNEDAPYVQVCNEFYEAEGGGLETEVDGRTIRVAFGTPFPRGFDTREQALSAAKEHVRTQFARVGVPADEVRVGVIRPGEERTPEAEQPVPVGRSADEGFPEGDTSH